MFQSIKNKQRKFLLNSNKDQRKDMVEDLKRISESREIAQASTLTHNTIEYDGKNNCC